MSGLILAWPKAIKRVWHPIATLKTPRVLPLDLLALRRAALVQEERDYLRCSGLTGTWNELMFCNSSDYTAYASSATEGSLIAGGGNEQPVIPATYFLNKPGYLRSISLIGRGVFSNTSTPTIIFQVRIGSTSGSSNLSGTSVGVSAAITTQSGVTNKWFEFRLDLSCRVTGIGSGNTTLMGSGYVTSPGGFASPFIYPLEPSTPDTATWTATIDGSVTNYVNCSATWSSSSASNTATLKQLLLYGLN